MTGFAADVATFAKKANASVDAVVRKVTFDLFFDVVQRTPVDTGRLKANWQASQNTPVRGTLTSTDKDGNKTMVAISGAIGGAGSVTYLANNLPYAHRIEFDGWSRTKAPAGMVRVSMARVQRLLSAAARQHKV